MSPDLRITLLCTAAGLVCLALFVAGRWAWGRPWDGHPRCRRCRFDLSGTYPAATCPECGADLKHDRAVLQNRRYRSRAPRARVAGLLAMALLLSLPVMGSRFLGVNWIEIKPESWLMAETRDADPGVVGPALRELARRHRSGALDNRAALALAEQGYEYFNEGAPCGVWNSDYGYFLGDVIAKGLFAGERKVQYMRNAVGVRWEVVEFEGDGAGRAAATQFVVMVYPFAARRTLAAAGGPLLTAEVQRLRISVGGVEQVAQAVPPTRTPMGSIFSMATVQLPSEWRGQQLELSWDIQMVDERTGAPVGDVWSDQRVIRLNPPVEGGARRQDDRVPQHTSHFF